MNKKRFILITLLIMGFITSLIPARAITQSALILNIEGVINPFTARYLARGLELAQQTEAPLLIITLDTPGGLETSMREMVQTILDSPIPVVVFVMPGGARATSAGLFILMAGDIAAMSPATNVGAASPIPLVGEVDLTASQKSISDAAALIRGLAEKHGRNVDWVEKAVYESKSLSASEAFENGVIDLIANDLDDLISQLNGRVIDGVALDLSNVQIEREPMNWVEKFYHVITDPNIAYLLLSLGTLFLLVELSDPGLSAAGIGAVICFGIGLMALGSLPINWVAIGMLVISLVLFVIALITDTEVVVTVIGLVPFVLGSLLLFKPFRSSSPVVPDLQVSLWLIIIMATVIVIFSLVVLRAILSASKRPPQSGAERLIGMQAVALTDLAPEGDVKVEQQIWSAISADDMIKKDQVMRVVGVSGVKLLVTAREEEFNHRLDKKTKKE